MKSVAVAIAVLVVCIGCEKGVKNPTYSPDTTGTGDTTGAGDTTGNGGGGNYGTLYFQMGAATRWKLDGTARVSQGALVSDNDSQTPGDTAYGSATLLDPVDFGDSRGLTFTWRGGTSNDASYRFFISDTISGRWQEAPYHTNSSDIEEARISIYLEPGDIYCRYEFTLPPQGQARVLDIRGYGW